MRSKLAFVTAFVLAMFAFAAPSFAATPPGASTKIVQSETFESGLTSVTVAPSYASSTAWWGVRAGLGNAGTSGLWCAGSWAGSGLYPVGTGGNANWQLPDTTGYYSSQVQFDYNWARTGAQDNDFFLKTYGIMADPNVDTAANSYNYNFGTGGLWQAVTIPRVHSGASLPTSVGDGPGYLQFRFFDANSATGSGVTLDNLKVSGVRFGPVRGVTAARVPAGTNTVHLGWSAPETHAGSGVAAPAPAYRVWESVSGSTNWSEVATTSATSLDLAGRLLANTYDYQVQAYDPDTTDVGAPVSSNQVASLASVTSLTNTVNGGASANVEYGSDLTFAGSLKDAGNQGLPSRTVSVEVLTSGGWVATGALGNTDASGNFANLKLANVIAAADYRVTFAGDAGGAHSGSSGDSLHVVLHAAPTAWALQFASPYTVEFDLGNATVQADLTSLANKVSGASASVAVQTSADGLTSWTTTGSVGEPQTGRYQASIPWANGTSAKYVRFHFAGDANHVAADSAVFQLVSGVASSAFSDINAIPAPTPYGAALRLRAKLTAPNSASAAAAEPIALQSKLDGGAWTTSTVVPVAEGEGHYHADVAPLTRTYYRFVFAGDGAKGYPATPDTGSQWTAYPTAYLTVTAPSKVRHAKSFTISGQVSTAAIARTVVIRTYRKSGKKWVLQSTLKPRVAAGAGGVVKYKLSTKFKKAGAWRMQATLGDTFNASTVTSYRSITTK